MVKISNLFYLEEKSSRTIGFVFFIAFIALTSVAILTPARENIFEALTNLSGTL